MGYSHNRNKGLTRTDVVVFIIGVIFLLFIFITANPFSRVRITPRRIMCATNLRGLATAITVYGAIFTHYPCRSS